MMSLGKHWPREATVQQLWLFAASLLFCFRASSAVLPQPGDLDTNGLLTTTDVSLLVNHLNATNDVRRPGDTGLLSLENLGIADVDGDGEITTNDVHRLVDGILGLPLNPFPRPIHFEPPHQRTNAAVLRLVAYFNEEINPALLSPTNITLVHLGRDRTFGTPDDSNVFSGTLTYSNAAAALVLQFTDYLPAGFYRATIQRPITDLASPSRMMTRAYSWDFATLGGIDTDGDGIPDYIERTLPVSPGSFILCNPNNPSTLGDGIRDGDRDADGDDLINAEEIFRFTGIKNWDSDGDGWADGVELADGKDPCDATSHPQWSVIGRPPVEIAALDGEVLGIGNFGTIVARPPVEITRPGADEALGTNNFGIIIGRPPVEIIRPGPDEALGTNNLGTIVGRPPVEIRRPAPGEALGTNNLGTIIARPPVVITNLPSAFAPAPK